MLIFAGAGSSINNNCKIALLFRAKLTIIRTSVLLATSRILQLAMGYLALRAVWPVAFNIISEDSYPVSDKRQRNCHIILSGIGAHGVE